MKAAGKVPRHSDPARLRSAYRRARAGEWLTARAADALACELAGVHPATIWPTWFDDCPDW